MPPIARTGNVDGVDDRAQLDEPARWQSGVCGCWKDMTERHVVHARCSHADRLVETVDRPTNQGATRGELNGGVDRQALRRKVYAVRTGGQRHVQSVVDSQPRVVLARDLEQLARLGEHASRRRRLVPQLQPVDAAIERETDAPHQLRWWFARLGDEMQLVRALWRRHRTLPSAGMTQIRFLGYEDSVRPVLSPKAPPAFYSSG